MRKNRSKFSAKRYPNLYHYPYSPNWVFRKHSKEKRKSFVFSTGLPATPTNEAAAYKKGLEEFDRWLGVFLPSGRQLLIRDLARAVLAAKEGSPSNYRFVKNQVNNHIIPHFGHFRPDQITTLRFQHYVAEERKRVYRRKNGSEYRRTRFDHTRRVLVEILNRALDEGLIERVPKLDNPDPEAAPPVYHSRAAVRKILHSYSRPSKEKKVDPRAISGKLLAYIMWKQGARPGEVLQYRFSMITWESPTKAKIRIPGAITKTRRPREIPLNSRVARILYWLKARTPGDCIFPSPTRPGEHMRNYDTAWNSACARAGVEANIYELRDTFITDALLRRNSSTFVAKYVDSSTEMIDKRYAVAIRQAMEGVAG